MEKSLPITTALPEEKHVLRRDLLGIVSALTNAVDHNTLAAPARYMLRRKSLFQDAYNELVKKADWLSEWELFYRLHCSLQLDLSSAEILPMPRHFHEPRLILYPWDMTPELLFHLCRRHFNLQFRGKAWDEFHKREKVFQDDEEKIAWDFFRNIQPVCHTRAGIYHEAIWVEGSLYRPLRTNQPNSDRIFPHRYEPSRCITLDEFLIFIMKQAFGHKDRHPDQLFRYPDKQKKTWCLGSWGAENKWSSPAGEHQFYPLISCERCGLIIHCEKREYGDEFTGTRLVARLY